MAIRGIGWAVMAVCALIIASYAAAMFILPGFGPPFVQDLGRGVVRPAAIQRSGHELTITSRMAPG